MGSTLVPPTVVLQRQVALERAQEIRLARSKLLHRLAGGSRAESCQLAAEMVAEVPDVLRTLSVVKFLEQVNGIGHSRYRSRTVDRILESCGIVQVKGLGELTVSQRAGLAAVLRARGAA